MKAVVFGAGKIARGFIGQLLYLNGVEITFVDVNKDLVNKLNEDASYHVHVLGDESLDSDVSNYTAVSMDDEKAIYDALQNGDMVFVSVGGANLSEVGKTIANIYHKYGMPQKILNFVTCENWKDSANTLQEGMLRNLTEKEKQIFDACIGVSEAVIMRSATQPSKEQLEADPTGVWVQNYWYLPICADRLKGSFPSLEYVDLKENFGSFLIQKMYTNNTSNAVIAYNGYLMGIEILAEAANNPIIAKLLDKVYQEINETLVKELQVDPKAQEAFAQKARAKYMDRIIVDRVVRHGADPIRKLGPNDRLIAPARMALNHGIYPSVIIDTIAKALYFDPSDDKGAMTLKAMRKEKGISYILKHICELDEQEILYTEVMKAVQKIQEEGLVNGHE